MSAGDRLVVGQVRGLHGLRGAVRVESLTDREDERFAVGRKL
jgi:ribosomal 30S subunit maturation factor RimM